MKRLLRSCILTAVLVTALPLSVFAAQMDAPSLIPIREGQAKVLALVTAGASGAPAGFTMQWMRFQDYQANGNQFYATTNPLQAEADFDGIPTLNTFNETFGNFVLPPNTSAPIELGDLFDETGLTANPRAEEELEISKWYIFRARANGDGVTDPSDWSNTFMIVTDTNSNCTYTQGYWKNHEETWPGVSLTLGVVTYSAEDLLAILRTPARGNGLLILAHQLIAVELNVWDGADATDVLFPRSDAHALIGSLVVPPIGSGSLPPNVASSVAQTLDDFNNGVTGPGHCVTTSVAPSTWSKMKASYR